MRRAKDDLKPAPAVLLKSSPPVAALEAKTAACALTPKRDSFARGYVETGNASEAYRRAYPTAVNWKPEAVHTQASILLSNSKVLERVNELQAEVAKRHNITVDTLVTELEEARGLAKTNGQAAAAVAATLGKAKLLGLIVDKKEVTGKDGGPIQTENGEKMDDIETLRRFMFLMSQTENAS